MLLGDSGDVCVILPEIQGDKMDRHLVRTQKLREVKGSAGAYERHQNTEYEPTRANPDSLLESDGLYANAQRTKPQELMGEAIEHLQGRQKQVYLLTVRQGLSFTEAAKKLHISKSAVEIYRNRAAKFITQYCESAIQRGELNG